MFARMFLFAACAGLYASGAVAGFDINVNDHALRMIYDYRGDPRRQDLVNDAGLLYAENDRNNSSVVIHLGLASGAETLRLGVRGILANPDGGDILALALGLQGRLWLTNIVSFGGEFFYAPNITSTLDGSGYRDLSVRFNFRINKSDDLYIGYRSCEVKLDTVNGAVEIDEGLHLGIKLGF